MRKVKAGMFVSLDGVVQAPGGPEEDRSGGFAYGGWAAAYWDEMMSEAMEKAFESPFDLLLGRKTYEIFAAHWPFIENDPIADRFNRVTKYVATSSTEPRAWQKSVALGADAATAIAKLKQGEGPDLLIQGSSGLVQTLLEKDLIDAFELRIYPLLLGRGKRLFGEGTRPAALKLTETRVTPLGVTLNTYVRAGDVVTGSFALEEPTEAELERREKVAREERNA